ncbi:MAG: heterodisulfide reductase subunit B, partial [Limisphaerales bacterium]
LDAYHDQIEKRWGEARIATVYFTQLMGLAFGLDPKQLGLQRNFVPMKPLPKRKSELRTADIP